EFLAAAEAMEQVGGHGDTSVRDGAVPASGLLVKDDTKSVPRSACAIYPDTPGCQDWSVAGGARMPRRIWRLSDRGRKARDHGRVGVMRRQLGQTATRAPGFGR